MNNENEQLYVIDGVIEFEPGARRMTNRISNKKVILHSTCSRCLHLLLEQQGVIVTHKQLLIYAWPDSHDDVTHNTFYQSVLNLRKAFSQVDYHQQVILTIRGKGLRISPGINLEKMDVSSATLNDGATLPPMGLEYHADCMGINNESDLPEQNVIKSTRKKSTVIVGLVLLFLCALIIFELNVNNNFYNSYVLEDVTQGGCNIFINKSSPNAEMYSYFKRNETRYMCDKNDYVYLTAFKNTTAVSAFVCDKKLNAISTSNCESYYYPDAGVNHEIK